MRLGDQTRVTPFVSILIPCYNAESWLAATLESALAQTPVHTEIIVVDDGSPDGSLALARTFQSRGVRVITQPNRGASAARNRALAAARGAWIQFLDADDLLAPDKLAQQLKLAAETGPDFALCSTWSRFSRSISDADFTAQPLCTDADPVAWMLIKFEQNRMMHPAAWLISRELAVRAGHWDEALTLDDDGEYFSRVVLASHGVRWCRDAVSYYRSGVSGSLSGTKSDHAWASALRSLESSTSRLLAAEDSPRTRQACATVLQRYIFECYPRATDSRTRAAKLVQEYGGSALQPVGGPKFQRLRRLLGWRMAKRLLDRLRRP